MTQSLPRPLASPMELAQLAAYLGVPAHGTAEVTGITADNRTARSGDLFAGVPGAHVHGARFAPQALAAGACAVLTDAAGLQYVGEGVPYICVEDVAGVLGDAASYVYGNPSRALRTFAVTGTNGKTTTAFMLDDLLSQAGASTGLIGTVEMRMAGVQIPSVLTTPQPADLQGLLASLVQAGGSDLVMEASSHALAQGRTDPICFSVAGFTNLTQDHLDFHETMEEYFEAKASLFTPRRSQKAVICIDDEAGERMHDRAVAALGEQYVGALAVYSTLGARSGWQVESIRATGEGTAFTMRHTNGTSITTHTTLPGSFNVANAALAIAMACAGGVDPAFLESLKNGVSPRVPGRMEVISLRPRVIVDFAHNTDALIKAMATLRETTEGKLITLTGAAGERDQGKRPAMGDAVARYSDRVIITDDDPHEEDPAAIRADVLAGTRAHSTPVVEIADRREAIAYAIESADEADTVFLAGRGHELVQYVAGGTVEFDDRVEARRAAKKRGAKIQGES